MERENIIVLYVLIGRSNRMLAYNINGAIIRVERCASGKYVVGPIPGIFNNKIAIGATDHADLAQSFLNSYAKKMATKTYDVLDANFEEPRPMDKKHCNGCIFWNGKGCEANGQE